MAQVARAQTEAAGGPDKLRSLSVQFRGMGMPEQELVVTSTVREVADGVAMVDAEARQGDTRVVRRGEAAAGPAPRLARVLSAPSGAAAREGDRRLRAPRASPWPRRRSPADPEVPAGPSTVRNELAVLEEHGLLAHPHTSAGRVPTDAGYRYYVDRLLPAKGTALEPRAAGSGSRSRGARSTRRCA